MLTFRALTTRQSDWRSCGLFVCLYSYIHSQLSTQFDNSKLPFQVSVDFSTTSILCFLFVRVKLNGNAIVSSHSVRNQNYNKIEEVV